MCVTEKGYSSIRMSDNFSQLRTSKLLKCDGTKKTNPRCFAVIVNGYTILSYYEYKHNLPLLHGEKKK